MKTFRVSTTGFKNDARLFSELKLAVSKPWLRQINPGWLIALLPLVLTLYFAGLIGRVAAGEIITASYAWVPNFGVNLSFYVDGLSLVFALLISGIGTLVTIYAGGYLARHPQLGRFYLYLLLFMTAMLGLVLSGNIITMFVFWELTSLSSYLLIGFNHRQAGARASALQALLVTGLGGLALLARFSPILGDTPAWQVGLMTFGAITMLLGAYLAWQQTDLKRILAYSTISALGTLVLLLGVGVVIYGWATTGQRAEHFGYSALLHLLLMGVSGAFLTGDMFNLYVWFELLLIASFVLLSLGGRRDQLEGAFKYVAINLFGSILFLAAVGILYGVTGTLNMADLAGQLDRLPAGLVTTLANAKGWNVLGREFLTMWQQAHGAPQGAVSVMEVQCGLIVLIENAFSQAELALARQSTDNLLQQYIEGLTRQILPMLTCRVEQAVGRRVGSTNITSDIEQNWMMVFLKFDEATL